MPSIFNEELYDPTELEYLNLAIENEQLEMLTSIVGTHSEMTWEKMKDIERVLSILRPPKQVVNYRGKLKDAIAKSEYAPAIKKPGRPKKVVETAPLEGAVA